MQNNFGVFLLTVLGLIFSGCQANQSVTNDDFSIYLVAQDISAVELSQIDINQLILEDKPIISGDDIVSYDKVSHSMELTPQAFARVQKIFPMPVKVDGIPFVVLAGKERVYSGGFWTPLSSLSYDGVIILQPLEETEKTIRIALGCPSSDLFLGNDPRADPRIIKILEEGKKLK